MSDRFIHAPSAPRQHRTSPSAETIARLAPGEDPAHVEAWMRLEHGTLEQIDRVLIAGAVSTAAERVRVVPTHINESLARFYGLR
jgi:alkylhydroperoxidase/carboxymuconolactone decarboxylase family protein YurZ